MAKEKDDRLRLTIYPPLRDDLEEVARERGTSAGVLAKEILQLYVREEAYKKAQELLNIEDRVGTAVLLELQPEFEFLREEILDMKEELLKLKEKCKNMPPPAPPKEEKKAGKTLFSSAEKKKEKKEEKPKLNYPTFVGIDYEIRGDRVYYDDGSVWSIKLGAWLHRGRKVMKIKRKKDEELGR